jgi:alanine dehydrogenase
MLVLSKRDLDAVLSMKDVIDAVEEGFKQYTLGTVTMPLRSSLPVPKYGGAMGMMPCFIDGMDALGLKSIGGWRDNPSKHNLPFIVGIVSLIDPSTGVPLALMNGEWITEMRTGAVTGTAAKYLAKEKSETVGLFGAGAQARTQLRAIKTVRDISDVRVYDPMISNRDRFCSDMSRTLDIRVQPAEKQMDAVKGCDIIVTATTSKVPVFDGEWLEEGTFISGVGSHFGPKIKELDAITVKRSRLVVDQREACLKEAGDIMDPIADGVIGVDHIYAELGELVTGKKNGRVDDKEITLFKSVGIALQDIATARKAYDMARTKGKGVDILDF